jgi:molecular chaperone HtpG
MDEIAVPALGKYRDRPFKAVDEGTLQAEEVKPDEQFQKLIDHLKGKLAEVSDIKLSSRLRESAACLVAGEGGMTAHRERLLHRMGRGADLGEQKRILELNAEHPAVKALKGLYEESPDDARVEEYARLLHDQAVIAEGSRIKDPAAFARRINDLLVQGAARTSGS